MPSFWRKGDINQNSNAMRVKRGLKDQVINMFMKQHMKIRHHPLQRRSGKRSNVLIVETFSKDPRA